MFLLQGTYSVTLDGDSTDYPGHAKPSKFQQVMFSEMQLSASQEHSIVLENVFYENDSAPYVDLDYIIVTQGDGNAT